MTGSNEVSVVTNATPLFDELDSLSLDSITHKVTYVEEPDEFVPIAQEVHVVNPCPTPVRPIPKRRPVPQQRSEPRQESQVPEHRSEPPEERRVSGRRSPPEQREAPQERQRGVQPTPVHQLAATPVQRWAATPVQRCSRATPESCRWSHATPSTCPSTPPRRGPQDPPEPPRHSRPDPMDADECQEIMRLRREEAMKRMRRRDKKRSSKKKSSSHSRRSSQTDTSKRSTRTTDPNTSKRSTRTSRNDPDASKRSSRTSNSIISETDSHATPKREGRSENPTKRSSHQPNKTSLKPSSDGGKTKTSKRPSRPPQPEITIPSSRKKGHFSNKRRSKKHPVVNSVEDHLVNTVNEYMVSSFDKWLMDGSDESTILIEPREPPGSFRYVSRDGEALKKEESTSSRRSLRSIDEYYDEFERDEDLIKDSLDDTLLGAFITACMPRWMGSGIEKPPSDTEEEKKALRPVDVPRPTTSRSGSGGAAKAKESSVYESASGFWRQWTSG